MPQEPDRLQQVLSAPQKEALSRMLGGYQVQMLSAVYWRNKAPWDLGMRVVHDSFFLFPVAGAVEVLWENGRNVLKPGEFLMLPENTPHHLRLPSEFPRLEQIAVHCHLHDRWHLPLLRRFGSPIGKLPHRSSWISQLRTLVSLLNIDAVAGQILGESLIGILLTHQLGAGNEFDRSDVHTEPRVERVQRYLREHFADSSLSVEQAANEVNLSPVQMRKLFLRYSGMTPKQHLHQIRMLESARLLRQSILSVKEIAAQCGFGSDHYFHLAFRKEHGCTPSIYRSRTAV